jgi:ribosomal protein S18 acetylase RimI-like enzyme
MMVIIFKASRPDWFEAVTIRRLVSADLPELEWDGEYTHFRRLYRSIYESARDGRALMWVADLPGKGIIGQVFVQLISSRIELADGKHRAYIYGFRVRPEYRNAGLGAYMLQNTEVDLERRGFSIITLNVGQNNPAARRLYERLGYRVTSTDPGRWSYLDEQGNRQFIEEPAWRMEKYLLSE